MTEYLETRVNNSKYKVATDYLYNEDDLWALAEGDRIRIGISDFLRPTVQHRRSLEVKPEGSQVRFGEEVAVIETVKAYVSLGSPVTGKVVEVNPAMTALTKDPYGAGWLAVLEATNWEADRALLMDAQTYFSTMKARATEKTQKT